MNTTDIIEIIKSSNAVYQPSFQESTKFFSNNFVRYDGTLNLPDNISEEEYKSFIRTESQVEITNAQMNGWLANIAPFREKNNSNIYDSQTFHHPVHKSRYLLVIQPHLLAPYTLLEFCCFLDQTVKIPFDYSKYKSQIQTRNTLVLHKLISYRYLA